MASPILHRITSLITTHTGIRVRESDYQQLAQIIEARINKCGLQSLTDYYAHLIRELDCLSTYNASQVDCLSSHPTSEWHALLTQLTVNESYFFRDRGQFNLITQTLLPELIARKRAQHQLSQASGLPSLRIWSAGCSTGEELYSLVIALEELNFPWAEWQTLLIGTDISIAALATAQKGCYSQWSFRQTDPAMQQIYFGQQRQMFWVRADLRKRATFLYGNLVKPPVPKCAHLLQSIDLIVCRNVFIYFNDQAISHTLDAFYKALNPDGYLLTGHAELYGQNTSKFRLKVYSESVVYKRPGIIQSSNSPPLSTARSPLNSLPLQESSIPSKSSVQITPDSIFPEQRFLIAPKINQIDAAKHIVMQLLEEAEAHLLNKNYSIAIEQANQACKHDSRNFQAYRILAQAHANTGEHSQAKSLCKKALRIDPFNLDLHYLLAQIAEEEGENDLAKEHLRRIIYIDSCQFKAYLELASIYQQERRIDQVNKMERLALETINLLPPTAIIDPDVGTTALEWRQYLQDKLQA